MTIAGDLDENLTDILQNLEESVKGRGGNNIEVMFRMTDQVVRIHVRWNQGNDPMLFNLEHLVGRHEMKACKVDRLAMELERMCCVIEKG